MQIKLGKLRSLIHEIARPKVSLSKQLGLRARKAFLSDPGIWIEFETKAALKAWLLDTAFSEENERLLIRWARMNLDRKELIDSMNIDELFAMCEKAYADEVQREKELST
jgi:hypothetical protein